MSKVQNALAGREQVTSLRTYLSADLVQQQIANALPRHLTPERVIRQVMTLVQKQPDLLQCTQQSILAGLVQASELGLELSGALGQAYLVPRFNRKLNATEATFQVGYRGLIDLAYRSGKVAFFSLRTVHAGDSFDVQYGTCHGINHTPAMDGEPGEAVAYYAVVGFQGGGKDFEVLSRAQAQRHRQRYSPPGRRQSAWDTNFDEMAEKTAAIRLAKRCPLSVEFQTAAAAHAEAEAWAWDEQSRVPPAPRPTRGEAVAELLDGVSTPGGGGDEAEPEPEPEPQPEAG